MIELTRQWVQDFTPHPNQLWEWGFYKPCECYAMKRGEEIIGIGDAAYMWEGRYMLWFFAGQSIQPYDWLPMLRLFVKTLLERHDINRLEFSVDANYAQAIRMAQILGFKREGHMRAYLPNGNDAYLYAWVRP